MRPRCSILALVLLALMLVGCATERVIATHGMVKENFYGLGPVHQKDETIFVQGMTQKHKQNGQMEQWPSYVILRVTDSCDLKTEWINPGELPKEMLAAPRLPYQREEYRSARERFEDFCQTQAPAKYYGGNWMLIRNPEQPDAPKQFVVGPNRHYRAKSSYPTFCLALTAAVLFDVVTIPFQIIIIESFKNAF
jgi:hypothetical protein